MSNSNSDLDIDNFNFNDDDNDDDNSDKLSLDDIKKKVDNNRKRIYKKKTPSKPKPTVIPKVSKVSKALNINANTDNDVLNQLKELILNQNEILNNLKSKPIRKQRVKKPVVERKTLDLTITDNDIKNIIDNNNNKNNNNIKNNDNKNNDNIKNNDNKPNDPKLQAFLDAFKK